MVICEVFTRISSLHIHLLLPVGQKTGLFGPNRTVSGSLEAKDVKNEILPFWHVLLYTIKPNQTLEQADLFLAMSLLL
jgi:hypothetical protein